MITASDTLRASPETIALNGQSLMLDAETVPFPIDLNQDGSLDLIPGSADGTIYLLNVQEKEAHTVGSTEQRG